jgi:hypothetical protein
MYQNTSHTQQRAVERQISLTTSQIAGIVYEYGDEDTDLAVIVAKCERVEPEKCSYYGRMQSNGDLVVLIIRNHRPVTLMYRRSDQTNTPAQLRVNKIIDLVH